MMVREYLGDYIFIASLYDHGREEASHMLKLLVIRYNPKTKTVVKAKTLIL